MRAAEARRVCSFCNSSSSSARDTAAEAQVDPPIRAEEAEEAVGDAVEAAAGAEDDHQMVDGPVTFPTIAVLYSNSKIQ